jgi:predicted nucleic acid-binding Zn ribbon protein
MTYDYKCKKCQKVEEKRHGMNETPVYLCCKQPMLKLISKPVGIHGANTGQRKGT